MEHKILTKTYATMKEVDEIKGDTLCQLTDLQLDFLGRYIESSIDHSKALIGKNTLDEVVSENIGFTNHFNGKIADFTHKTIHLLEKARGEVIDVFEDTKPAASKTAEAIKPDRTTKPKRAVSKKKRVTKTA